MKKKKMEFLEDPIGISIDAFEEEFFRETSSASSEHPSLEQLMIRQALKRLTPKQTIVWNFYNYDRLTQDEIAIRLGITRTSVQTCIKGIENKIAKYCKQRMEVYKLLKEQENSQARLSHARKVTDWHNQDSKY